MAMGENGILLEKRNHENKKTIFAETFKQKIMKLKTTLIFALLTCSIASYAQSNAVQDNKKDSIYFSVEQQPEFPGGMNALMQFIGKNIQYPEIAKRDSLQGKVYIQFTVEKDGSVSDVIAKRGFNAECEKEAIRVFKMMPNWIPGKQKGEPVRVSFMMPINFKL